ncbi:MAG: hypothetical protein HDS15_05530 [Bacteroides sp.]|nr:hypothetical protein [Bacteroides sp.]
MDILTSIMDENRRRTEKREIALKEYDPLTGLGAIGERKEVIMWGIQRLWLPTSITGHPRFSRRMKKEELERMRLGEEFEYWCARCVMITHKLTGEQVNLVLNPAQRKIAERLEAQRRSGKPIRMIILKARQWGCSTLVQMYFAWIQIVKKEGWNSLICAHVKETAATIRGMYEQMLDSYPRGLWPHKDAPRLKSANRGTGCQLRIAGRKAKIAIGSSMAPDSLRGTASSLAHLSEVAFWSDTRKRKPLQFLRTVCGTIPSEPMTAIVIESTANGTGNFFHQAWTKAERGMSAYEPVFVAWHEIPIYSTAADEQTLRSIATSMSDYERELWEEKGVTLEQLNWYRNKLKEYTDHTAMKAEFPSNPTEAFLHTGSNVFGQIAVEKLREGCTEDGKTYSLEGDRLTGPAALHNLRLREDPNGKLTVWRHPAKEGNNGISRYVAAVDIGGRSDDSDWSVIAVFDRHGPDGKPEIAAQWRGHADHDIVAWQAAMIAKWYDRALLVIESNTLETSGDDASLYLLSTLRRYYGRLYVRQKTELSDGGYDSRPGFHTNRRSKLAALTVMIAAVRDGEYTEHDENACDEMSAYERKPNGTYGAKDGHHDDIVMTRAIGLYVISETHQQQENQECRHHDTHRVWW